MHSQSQSWISFWSKDNIFNSSMLSINNQIYNHNLGKIIKFSKNDSVLDIGCGLGHTIDYLKSKVKDIHGIDVSPYYVKCCQKKYRQSKNVHIHQLNPCDYTNLTFLQKHKFSIVLCNSIIQYYRDEKEVIQLINSIKKITKPKATLLISDIITSPSIAHDLIPILLSAIKYHHLSTVLKFFIKSRISNYYQIRGKTPLLILDQSKIRSITKQGKINFKIINNPLSLNTSRKHLLITY